MKKDFENNPAFSMLSGLTEAENKTPETAIQAKTTAEPAPKKKNARATFEPIRKELKSRKLLVLLKPTVYEKVHAKAKEYELSTNELINQIIEASV